MARMGMRSGHERPACEQRQCGRPRRGARRDGDGRDARGPGPHRCARRPAGAPGPPGAPARWPAGQRVRPAEPPRPSRAPPRRLRTGRPARPRLRPAIPLL